MITQERIDEMHDLFWAETNDEESQEWRDYLTAEESALIGKWDDNVESGLRRLAQWFLDINAQKEAIT